MNVETKRKSHSSALRRSAIAVAVGMCLTGVAMAQSTTGSIYGTVRPGTVVVVTGSNGITRTLTVGPDGRYSIGGLPGGDYKVEAKGLGTLDATVTIGGGTDASFNTLETVTVSGNRLKVIDITQTDTRTVFTSDMLSKIAVGHSLTAVALLAPGVVTSTSYTSPSSSSSNNNPLGRSAMANIGSFGGSSASENAYYINGFPVTNPLTNMGATTLPFNSIGQVQVLTGGYGAEFGRSTGGVVNVITKRGTDEVKGGAYVIWTPAGLRGDPKDLMYPDTGKWNSTTHYNTTLGNNPNNWTDGTLLTKRALNRTESLTTGAYMSGPILKDRLYIFANVEETSNQVSGVSATRVGALTSSTAAQGWSESSNSYPRSTLKLDWNIATNHLLEFTTIRDNAQEAYANYGFDYKTMTRDAKSYSGDHLLDDNSRLYIAKYTGNLTDNLTVSAMVGTQKINHNPDPLPGYNPLKNYVSISPTTVPAAFAGIANPQPYSTVTDPSADVTKGYRLDMTYTLAKHEIRAGYDQFKAASSIGTRNSGPNSARWIYSQMSTPTESIDASHGVGSPASAGGLGANGYFVDQYFLNNGGAVSTLQSAYYLEDRWQVTDNLLLSLGFRNDSFTNYNGDKKAYVEQKGNKGPRLGAVWDVRGNSSLKMFGNYGRYFLALPNNVAIRGANSSLNSDKYYTYDSIAADGTPVGLHAVPVAAGASGLCATGTPGAGSISSNLECGNAPDPATVAIVGLKPHYQDEFILGFEQQLSKQWNWGAKLTYRDLKSAIDDTCPDECRIFNPGEAATFKIPQADGTYQLVSYTATDLGFPKLKRKLAALDLFAEYQDNRLYGKVEYTISHNFGNAEGQLNSSVDTGSGGQQDVSVTSDWDLPEIMQGANGNLPNNRTHQIKLFGSYKVTEQWRVGGSAIVQSGRPNDCSSYYPYAKAGIYNSAVYYHYCGVPGAQTASSTPVTPDAGYAASPRGTTGNTPWTKTFNVSVAYTPELVKGLTLQADVQNVLNAQDSLAYYQVSASSRSTASSQYGRTLYYSAPRSVRLTGRYDF